MPATMTPDPADGIIRCGKAHHKHGDPIDAAISYKADGTSIRLFAARGNLPPEEQQHIVQLLLSKGFRHIVWERSINDKLVRRAYNRETQSPE